MAAWRSPYDAGVRLSPADIADAIEAGLRAELARRDHEQSVYGLDSLDELALHPILAASLRKAGFGVHREQRYPADRAQRRVSMGERCDFVLTPDLRDLIKEDSRGTLFDDPNAVALDEAYWLEVKVVAQFNSEGPNGNYASHLMSAVREDVGKLAKDPAILQAGLLIVLFVREELVAEHDLTIWQDRCLERGLPLGAPSRRAFPMTDRHGNGCCAIAVYPVPHV